MHEASSDSVAAWSSSQASALDVGAGFRFGGDDFAASGGAPVVIGDRVAGDPEHPGGEPFPVVERAEVLVDAHHDLGDDVVGLVRVADPAADETLASTAPTSAQTVSTSSGWSVWRSSVIVIPIVHADAAPGRSDATFSEKHPTYEPIVSTSTQSACSKETSS